MDVLREVNKVLKKIHEKESKIMFKEPVVMRTPDAAKFLLFMKVWSPFQMVVSKVRRPREKIFSSKKCQEPEIVVDLVARDGILVSTKLRCSSLKHLLRKVDVSSLNSTSSPSVNITSDSGLISSSSALGPPSESLKPLEKVRLWMQLDQIVIKNQVKVLNNDISKKLPLHPQIRCKVKAKAWIGCPLCDTWAHRKCVNLGAL